MIALLDCNNFYVSCERVQLPFLEGKPTVVFSNNDGCAISRSQEAKDMKIKMGEFESNLRPLINSGKLFGFSSNYTTYAELSWRVQQVVMEFCDDIEKYSIDEMFINLRHHKLEDLELLAKQIRKRVKQYTGIPVSIGIGKTKTLAKIANRIAKVTNTGVYYLNTAYKTETALKNTQIEDVWGVGRRYSKKLINLGIVTALDFIKAPAEWVNAQMTIVGLRTWYELAGKQCFSVDQDPPDNKGICKANSFSNQTSDYTYLEEALSSYVSVVAKKLRAQGSLTTVIQVFVNTNRFKDATKCYFGSHNIELSVPSNLTSELLHYAINALKCVYKPGYLYQKVGFFATGLIPANSGQQFLHVNDDHRKRLLNASTIMDRLNTTMGRDTVRFAVLGFEGKWKMRQNMLTAKFLTDINEIVLVKAV